MTTIKIFAPASTANFIVGFDSLGLALKSIDDTLMGDIVTIKKNAETVFSVTGKFAHKVPKNIKNNIISHCCDFFHQKLQQHGKAIKNFHLELEKCLPVGSGLGSSASSIVAVLVALNIFYNEIFSKQILLQFAGEMEAHISGNIHYDNVAPSLYGGFQLLLPGKPSINHPLPFFEDWHLVIHYPGIAVTTQDARNILPKSFKLADVRNYWQKLATFIHALHTKNRTLAIGLLQDTLIEPHRASLIPHFSDTYKSALNAGALAFGISGSGPSYFALVDTIQKAKEIKKAITEVAPHNKEALSWICTIDQQGARPL